MAVKKEFENVEFHGDVSFFADVTVRIATLVIKALTMVGAFILTGDLTMIGALDVTGDAVISGDVTLTGKIGSANVANLALGDVAPLISDFNGAFGIPPDGFVGVVKDSNGNKRWLATTDYAGSWSHVQLTATAVS